MNIKNHSSNYKFGQTFHSPETCMNWDNYLEIEVSRENNPPVRSYLKQEGIDPKVLLEIDNYPFVLIVLSWADKSLKVLSWPPNVSSLILSLDWGVIKTWVTISVNSEFIPNFLFYYRSKLYNNVEPKSKDTTNKSQNRYR